MAMVRKITAKIVCGKPDKKEIINSDGDPIWMMTVYGNTHRSIAGETDYGPYLKFRGKFEAVNIVTGELFTSMNLILPPIAEELVEDALTREGVSSVDFALKVGVRRDDDAISGYQWVAESVTETEGEDPVARMRAKLQDMKVIPLLGNPEETAESEPEAKPASRTRGGRKGSA